MVRIKWKGNNITENAADASDKHLSIVVALIVLGMFLVNLIGGITQLNVPMLSVSIKGLLGLIILFRINIVIKRFTVQHAVILLLSGILILLNLLLFPECDPYFYGTIVTYVLTILPILLYIVSIRDYSHLFYYLIRISFLITAIVVICFLSFEGAFNDGIYNMGFSSSLVIPTLMLLYNFERSKGWAGWCSLGAAGLCMFVSLAWGSRGCFLSFGAYCIFMFVRYIKDLFFDRGQKGKAVSIVGGVVLLVLFRMEILALLDKIFMALGITSRSLLSFAAVDISLTGRNEIYRVVYSAYQESPFAVRGINSDFLIVGGYSHNIALELLYQFGIIGACILYAALLVLIVITFKNRGKTEKGKFAFLFMCASLPILMVSGTLWSSPAFWSWVVLALKPEPDANQLKGNRLCNSEI